VRFNNAAARRESRTTRIRLHPPADLRGGARVRVHEGFAAECAARRKPQWRAKREQQRKRPSQRNRLPASAEQQAASEGRGGRAEATRCRHTGSSEVATEGERAREASWEAARGTQKRKRSAATACHFRCRLSRHWRSAACVTVRLFSLLCVLCVPCVPFPFPRVRASGRRHHPKARRGAFHPTARDALPDPPTHRHPTHTALRILLRRAPFRLSFVPVCVRPSVRRVVPCAAKGKAEDGASNRRDGQATRTREGGREAEAGGGGRG
jgi:hypothetical protein